MVEKILQKGPKKQGAQNENKTLSENFQTAPDQNFGSHFSHGRSPLIPNPTPSSPQPPAVPTIPFRFPPQKYVLKSFNLGCSSSIVTPTYFHLAQPTAQNLLPYCLFVVLW